MSEDKAAAPQARPAAAAAPAPVPEAAKAAETPDYYGQLLRLKAEFENYRKRVDREKPQWHDLGRASVLSKLLPLYDLLEHAHREVKGGYADTPLAKGMDAIFREFEKVFKEEGLKVLDPKGQAFDPHYHEAVGFADEPGTPEGAVADVMQTGILLGDKVLRPARVRLQKKTIYDEGKKEE